MASVFTKILLGELPARFVWQDDRVVAFLSIAPLAHGHTLVVPREEIDHWLDLPPDLLRDVMATAHAVGKAIQHAFKPVKVGMLIAGLEVPHVHVHLSPINAVRDLDFGRQDRNPDPAQLDAAAASIRTALRELGFTDVVPEP